MPYVRLTLAQARPEVRPDLLRHYRELVAHVRSLPGCLDAYVVESNDDHHQIGRMSFWESADAASKAANDPHAMSLHAEVQFEAQGELWDRSFDATQ